MIELMRQMLSVLPIESVDNKEVLIFKGLHKLPKGYTGFKQQFKFNHVLQKVHKNQ